MIVPVGLLVPPTRRLCFHPCLSVNRISQNCWTNLYEIFWNGWTLSSDQSTRFRFDL